MQALPTPLTTAQLDGLLATIETLPSATVIRRSHTVGVVARKKATGEYVPVFKAVSRDGETWTAEAVPGLISIN